MKVKDLLNLTEDLKDLKLRLQKYFPDLYSQASNYDVKITELNNKIHAFCNIEKKLIEFNSAHYPPRPQVLLHEICHIYYNTPSEFLNTHISILINSILNEKIRVKNAEKFVKEFVEMFKKALSSNLEDRKEVCNEIVKKISEKFRFYPPVYPHLYVYYLAAGVIPEIQDYKIFQLDLSSEKWKEIEINYNIEPYQFLSEMVMGIYYLDPFFTNYAKAIFENF